MVTGILVFSIRASCTLPNACNADIICERVSRPFYAHPHKLHWKNIQKQYNLRQIVNNGNICQRSATPVNTTETMATPSPSSPPLRKGWTTGACATAATKAALIRLFTGQCPDAVRISLPKGERPRFEISYHGMPQPHAAAAGVVKDAGDDPDVTHGALIIATVSKAAAGSGINFAAGNGVGTITKPGLPLPVGQPAINPVPRQMMAAVCTQVCAMHGQKPDIHIEISVPDGIHLAPHTWNPRLGILGGISILGTTGIVHPFSCAAWIHSIHRGIDVAVATHLPHIVGATGSTSEKAALAYHQLTDADTIDMGDFIGGTLKYLRNHPVPRFTLAGGFAKLVKFAQGHGDVHSGRSQVDFEYLASSLAELGASEKLQTSTRCANTALHVLMQAQAENLPLPHYIATQAHAHAQKILGSSPVNLDVLVIDRQGTILAQYPEPT
jgi:cobalt-precorrin-5B (C1)-methyltransferase